MNKFPGLRALLLCLTGTWACACGPMALDEQEPVEFPLFSTSEGFDKADLALSKNRFKVVVKDELFFGEGDDQEDVGIEANEFHQWHFCAPAGARVLIDTRTGTDKKLNTVMQLNQLIPTRETGVQGRTLTSYDKSNGKAFIETVIPTSGWYEVLVGTPNGRQEGDYSLQLRCTNEACTVFPGTCPQLDDPAVIALNNYAYDRMQEANQRVKQKLIDKGIWREGMADFASKQGVASVDDAAPGYVVEVGSWKQCGPRNAMAGFAFLDSGVVEDLQDQIEMAIAFLEDFHVNYDGTPSSMIKTVRICTERDIYLWENDFNILWWNLALADNFLQHGSILTVKVPLDEFYKVFGTDELYTAEQLNTMWDDGQHFNVFGDGQDMMREKLKMFWPVLNPIGLLQTTKRHLLASRGTLLGNKLKGFLDFLNIFRQGAGDMSQDEQDARLRDLQDELVQRVTEAVPAEYAATIDPGHDVVSVAAQLIDQATPEQLDCTSRVWKEYVENPQRWANTVDAATAITLEPVRNKLAVKVFQEQTGGLIDVRVGNTHFINVNLDMFLSQGYSDLQRYVSIKEVEQNIEWHQEDKPIIDWKGAGDDKDDPWNFSLYMPKIVNVAVYTIDDISVGVQVSYEHALEAAGLDAAVSACFK